jgi:serine/threonine protein kinase
MECIIRDLRPENVLVGTNDDVKLINFGMAAKAGARRIYTSTFDLELPRGTNPWRTYVRDVSLRRGSCQQKFD